jgi:uncharacterized membrane protein YphA (DoxX/SURF4 family)
MGIVQRFHHWNGAHPSLLLTIVRIVLGMILLLKGITFISNAEQLRTMILQSQFSAGTTFLVSYITFAHLFGGVFLIIGLLTRLAVILQLPILIGALFFNITSFEYSSSAELVLSFITLFMLVYVLVKGPGELSMDYYLKHYLL